MLLYRYSDPANLLGDTEVSPLRQNRKRGCGGRTDGSLPSVGVRGS